MFAFVRINVEDNASFDVVGLCYVTRINVEDHALFAFVGLYCDTRLNVEDHYLLSLGSYHETRE